MITCTRDATASDAVNLQQKIEQVGTVIEASVRFADAAQIDPSYPLGDTKLP